MRREAIRGNVSQVREGAFIRVGCKKTQSMRKCTQQCGLRMPEGQTARGERSY